MKVAAINNYRPFFNPIFAPKKKELIKTVALRTLAELVVFIAIGAAVSFFIATPAGVALVCSVLATHFLVSTLFRMTGAYASHKMYESPSNYEIYAPLAAFSGVASPALFALTAGSSAQTLIHEMGHAGAASLLFQGRPRITLEPFGGGVTTYTTRPTSLGARIGRTGSILIVTALGAALSLFVSSLVLAIGIAIRKTHPHLAAYLIFYGSVDFISHMSYAASAYWASPQNLSHDFVRLAHFGTPPIVATVGIAALPILISVNTLIFSRASSGTALQRESGF